MIKNNVILLSQDEEKIKFKQIFSLDPEYIGQAIGMAQVFQDAIEAIEIDGKQTLRFNFDKALTLVKKHSEMAIVGILDQTIVQENSEVSAMMDKVIELFTKLLAITLTEGQVEEYKTAIGEAFTNLSKESGDAWIFWQQEQEHKTTYQYNILFAIQNETTGSVMLAMPLSLTITVEKEKEKVLFITVKDKASYEVNIQSLKVVEALK